jgi:hypothetical protein
MDFHLGWVSAMLSASFAVSLLGRAGLGWCKFGEGERGRGGWRVWRESNTAHGSLKLGDEEGDCEGCGEVKQRSGLEGKVNEYCNDLNNFSAQKMPCKLFERVLCL